MLEDHTYKCGHTVKIDSSQYYRFGIPSRCPACVEKYRAKRSLESGEFNEKQGLPALEGSEKQVAWAETIRASIVKRINKVKIAPAKCGHGYQMKTSYQLYDFVMAHDSCKLFTKEEAEEKLNALKNEIFSTSEAKWWIDHRKNDLYAVLYAVLFMRRHFFVFPLNTREYRLVVAWPEVGDYVLFEKEHMFRRQKFQGIVVALCIDNEDAIVMSIGGQEYKVNLFATLTINIIRKDNVEGMFMI